MLTMWVTEDEHRRLLEHDARRRRGLRLPLFHLRNAIISHGIIVAE